MRKVYKGIFYVFGLIVPGLVPIGAECPPHSEDGWIARFWLQKESQTPTNLLWILNSTFLRKQDCWTWPYIYEVWSESNLVAAAILNLTSLLRMFRSGATQCSAVHCIEGDKRWSLKLDTEPTTSTKTAVNSTQRWRSTSQSWVQPPVVLWARQWRIFLKSWWKALCHQIFRGSQWFQCFFNAVNSFEFLTSFDSPLSWFSSSISSSSSSTCSSPVQPCLESKHDLHPVHPLPHPPLRPRHPLEAQAQLWHRHFPASGKARQGSPHHHHFTPKHLSII